MYNVGKVVYCTILRPLCFLVSATSQTSNSSVDHSMDPDFYKCPFSMFDAGKPSTDENGAVMYCDGENDSCPSWYFCSAGYDDGRAVCCHILGKFAETENHDLNYLYAQFVNLSSCEFRTYWYFIFFLPKDKDKRCIKILFRFGLELIVL